MFPALHACADRLIYDAANVKYLATSLPRGALDRKVEDTGWTVRQSFMHIGGGLLLQAACVANIVEGKLPLPEGFDMDEHNRLTVTEQAPQPLPEILGAIDLGRARLLAAMEGVTEELGAKDMWGRPFIALIGELVQHALGHAIAIFDAVPELRYDPMLLNWFLYAEFKPGSDQFQRQQRLLDDVRQKFGRLPGQGDIDSDDDDDGEWDDDDADEDEG